MRRPSKLSNARASGSRSDARSTPPLAERVSRAGPGTLHTSVVSAAAATVSETRPSLESSGGP